MISIIYPQSEKSNDTREMELTTNGVVITDAIKYVQGQMDDLNKTEKALLQDIKQKE